MSVRGACQGMFVKAASILFVLSLFLLSGCSRESPPTESDAAALPSLATSAGKVTDTAVAAGAEPASAPEASALVPPPGEPPEEVLRKLEFQRYDMIEKAGGLPVTVSATGRQLVLKPRLYSVRKESCKPEPQAPEGWYECSLVISLSLAADGSDPSEQGERISVKWDGKKAEWVLN